MFNLSDCTLEFYKKASRALPASPLAAGLGAVTATRNGSGPRQEAAYWCLSPEAGRRATGPRPWLHLRRSRLPFRLGDPPSPASLPKAPSWRHRGVARPGPRQGEASRAWRLAFTAAPEAARGRLCSQPPPRAVGTGPHPAARAGAPCVPGYRFYSGGGRRGVTGRPAALTHPGWILILAGVSKEANP